MRKSRVLCTERRESRRLFVTHFGNADFRYVVAWWYENERLGVPQVVRRAYRRPAPVIAEWVGLGARFGSISEWAPPDQISGPPWRLSDAGWNGLTNSLVRVT